jgi:hypothetical protein
LVFCPDGFYGMGGKEMSYPGKFGEVCRHGSLMRSCQICDLESQLAEVTAERDRLKNHKGYCHCHDAIEEAAREISRLKAEMKTLSCPICGSDVDGNNWKQKAERYKKALNDILDYGKAIQPNPVHPVTFNACCIAQEALTDFSSPSTSGVRDGEEIL